ncbi:MAG TPA: hypothetical protein VKB35_17845 [Ktedonobacteraceae bacterium]|nr:hypothetical protein [Ktedonobacteraceae bacterium]
MPRGERGPRQDRTAGLAQILSWTKGPVGEKKTAYAAVDQAQLNKLSPLLAAAPIIETFEVMVQE